MTWAIKTGWRYEAVKVLKETEKMVFYSSRTWRDTRASKGQFLPWRGEEAEADALVAKLTSAEAEYDRRRKAAADWFNARNAEILGEAARPAKQQSRLPSAPMARRVSSQSGAIPTFCRHHASSCRPSKPKGI
jgi:hypothetical protein